MKPLADKVRPTKLEEIVGQQHIIGNGKLLSKIITTKHIPNMIFYGPSGTGKTTIANIIAKESNKKFYKINGTNTNTDEIKDIISQIGTLETQSGILLYIDELHYLNKRQQQNIMEYIETGDITLIGSTTENVHFSIFKAILSRCILVEFKELLLSDIIDGLKRVIHILRNEFNRDITYSHDALMYIAEISNGDLRRGINILELVLTMNLADSVKGIVITVDKVMESHQSRIMNYDKDSDGHYNLLSYLQKSIRGSDAQASIHALARLIKSGDLNSICRRLLVIASEDVGLAYPQAIVTVKACVDSALMLGFPEARIPLAQATIMLATAPKSNAAYKALDAALHDLDGIDVGQIPNYLCDKNSNIAINCKEKYLYPHDYPNNYIEQQYLPDKIKDKIYYKYGENKFEQASKMYWEKIKGL